MPKAELYKIDTAGKVANKPDDVAEKDGPKKNQPCAEQQLLLKIKDSAAGNRYLMVVNAWPCCDCIEKLKAASKKHTIFVRATNGKTTIGEYATHHLNDIVADANRRSAPAAAVSKPGTGKEKKHATNKYAASSSSSSSSSSSPSPSSSSSSHETSKFSLIEKIIATDGKEAGVVIVYTDGVPVYVPYGHVNEFTTHASINSTHGIDVVSFFTKLV